MDNTSKAEQELLKALMNKTPTELDNLLNKGVLNKLVLKAITDTLQKRNYTKEQIDEVQQDFNNTFDILNSKE